MNRQASGGFDLNSHMPPWYGYQNQPPQPMVPPNGYCIEQEQMWHPTTPHPAHTGFFHNDYHHFMQHNQCAHQTAIPPIEAYADPENQLPSPPITVSGSEVSSPGTSGNVSPPNHLHNTPPMTRPPPARSPYEWIKKTSYQNQQPAPELASLNAEMLPFNMQDCNGKTRTKDKYRVVYSDHQRVELEKEFYYSRYITIRRKAELASNLGLTERQVKIWFQNRRAKERKQVKKREELSHKDNSVINNNISHHQQMMATQHMAQSIIPVPLI